MSGEVINHVETHCNVSLPSNFNVTKMYNMTFIKKNLKSITLIIIVVFVFISTGLYHLNQFETSDEHFWRLERIPQYWTAISTGNLKQTYINDKPGVSIAIISGMGLPFVSQDKSNYNSTQEFTMALNYALRLPLLLFNGLVMLPLLFWLLTRAFNRRVASIGIILIGVNPILIGISQIINPDALLWSFSTGAILAFFVLLKTNKKKFVIITGLLTGAALLSKYTANLLFVFYIIIAGLHLIYFDISNTKKWLQTLLKNYLYIFLISILVFVILLPATLFNFSLFLYGTLLSPPLKPIIIPLSIIIALFAIDAFLLKAKLTIFLARILKKIQTPILYLSILPLLFLVLFALINAWTDAHFIALDNLKETVADTQKLIFPMLEGLPRPAYFAGEIAIQSFNILFALTPIILLFTTTTIILVFLKKIPKKYFTVIIFCTIIPFFFFIGGLLTETFVNIRYALILVPLFAILASIGLDTIFTLFTRRDALQPAYRRDALQPVYRRGRCVSTTMFSIFLMILFFVQGISVYLSAPYYFNYQSTLLPKKFILTDSWSYGIFETTQYLNSLPNAQDLTIWSDRKAVCYYFVGNCIMSRKIDTTKDIPDYFIVTRRGVLRHHFKWLEPFEAPYSVDTIYSKEILDNPIWQLNILNRPENYIKVIDTHNLSDLYFVNDVQNIQPPTFPKNVCNIKDFGAKSTFTKEQINRKIEKKAIVNEKDTNTRAFKKAINDCSQKGGGTVEVPKGLWFTKAITLKNNINLHLDKDATILFSDNPDDFLPVVKTRFVGLDVYNYSPMIYAQNVSNVAITGEGTIDGNGKTPIWDTFIGNQKKSIKKLYKMSINNVPVQDRVFGTISDALRPSLIQFYNSKNILIDGITVLGGPMWTIHPVYSQNIIIQNTDIKTVVSNGDGIVIDSSKNVLIQNDVLSTSDDAIVIKSGRDKEGWTVNRPSRNIVIQNNAIDHAHAGIGIGSEMSGGVENVLVDNIKINNADRGFRLKTTLGRGGFVKNVIIRNSHIDNPKKDAININMNYGSSTIKPKTKLIPTFQNIKFKDITVTTTRDNVIIIDGIKNNLSQLLFSHIDTNNKKSTATIKNAKQILLNDVNISHFSIQNSKDVTLTREICSTITQQNTKNIYNKCKK